MTGIVWNQVNNFQDELFNTLKDIEASDVNKRFKIHNVNGNPTIGIGFDLQAGGKDVQDAVMLANPTHKEPVTYFV